MRILLAWAAAFLAWPAAAAAEISFQWSVPERLGGTGVKTAARDIDSAATPPPTVVDLRSCLEGATWKLDGETADVEPNGRCTYRLQLGDAEQHEVTLEAGGESVTAPVVARDFLVVSIGDSVASGEGNPDGPDLLDPRWLERRCHRSMRSGAAQAALALEAGSPHSSVTFLPLACSGATVARGLLGPYGGVQKDRRLGDLPAQVEEVAELQRRRPIDALLLSVGANDVYFAPLAMFCARFDPCPQRRFDPRDPLDEAPRGTDTAEVVHAAAQGRLRGEYDRLAEALAAAGVEPARVIAVEYFNPTRDETGSTCEALLPGVRVSEAEWAESSVLGPLNAEVRATNLRHGWRVVGGVQDAFARHGICADGRKRWVVRIPDSLLRGARLSGPLHPNEAGHQATAALIAPVLADTVAFEGGTAAAQIAGDSEDDGGIEWLQVALGALAGAIAGGVAVLAWRRQGSRTRS
jgi:lysophospholipase L1-like esterase